MFTNHKMSLATCLLAGLLALEHSSTASALVVDPFFAGHNTVTLANDASAQVPIGFNYLSYPYYGGDLRSSLYINSNGNITFDSSYTSANPDLQTISNATNYYDSLIGAIYAPLWTDLNPALGGQITYGNPTPDTFAVSWVNVPHTNDPTVTNTFQLILFAGSTYNPGLTLGTYSTNTGIQIQANSTVFAYDVSNLNLTALTPAAIGITEYDWSVRTLNPLGIGNASGNVTSADVAALRASDPYLFDGNRNSQPVAFSSVVGLSSVPVPAAVWLFGSGLLGLIGVARRKARSA